MKFLVLLVIIGIGLVGYRMHMQTLKEAQESAELLAYNQANAQIERERAARAEEERKAAAARERRPAMAIARVLEPFAQMVEMPLNLQEPEDLVPVIQNVKARIMEKRAEAEPARVVVFDRAAAVLNYLAALAEERTKTLKSMIRNQSGGSSLAGTGSFFSQSVSKHWDDTLVRARPAVEQLLEQLRASEREWNKHARQNSAAEQYEIVTAAPVMIPGATTVAEPISRAASQPSSSRSMRSTGGGSATQRTTPGQ